MMRHTGSLAIIVALIGGAAAVDTTTSHTVTVTEYFPYTVTNTPASKWDSSASSSGSSGASLGSLKSSSSGSLDSGSSGSTDSSMDLSSGSQASGSSGFYLRIWQWFVVGVVCCLCCLIVGITALLRKNKKSSKKKRPSPPPPASEPVVMEEPAEVAPLLSPLPPLVAFPTNSVNIAMPTAALSYSPQPSLFAPAAPMAGSSYYTVPAQSYAQPGYGAYAQPNYGFAQPGAVV